MSIPRYDPQAAARSRAQSGSSFNSLVLRDSLQPPGLLLPPPALLGGPEQYTSWRPGQEAAIMASMDAETKYVISCLPTGAGKSLIYMMEAIMTTGRTLVLTSTNALQDQLMKDGYAGLVDVRGQTKYPCHACGAGGEYEYLNPSRSYVTVAEGPCMDGEECTLKNAGCDYFDAIRAASKADKVVTSYAMWLTQAGMPPNLSIGEFDLIICDEAHATVEELCGYLAVEIWKSDTNWISRNLELTFPDGDDVITWRDWGKLVGARVVQLVEESRDKRLKKIARKLLPKLTRLGTMTTDNWVGEKPVNGGKLIYDSYDPYVICRFDPIWPLKWAKPVLFRGAKKVILSSATVRPKTATLLGIDDEELTSFEAASTFPLSARPIYHIPSLDVNFRITEEEMRCLVEERIDVIMAGREDRKGIIHTVSYKRQREILNYSGLESRMIAPNSKTTKVEIERFRHLSPATGAVLASPAVTTGYDFPFDECEYQIIVKVPRPDTRSKVMKARQKDDPAYINYVAMQELVQMSGRGMRDEEDRCETFVIDDSLLWFLKKNRGFAPQWWLDAVKKDVWPIPVAAEKLENRRYKEVKVIDDDIPF